MLRPLIALRTGGVEKSVLGTCKRECMAGRDDSPDALTESQVVVDKKTAMVGALALVAGMILWALFQNQLPFQTREQTQAQIDKLTMRLDSQDQRITALSIQQTHDEGVQSQAISDSYRSSMDTQKALSDLKTGVVQIQTQLDDMKKTRER